MPSKLLNSSDITYRNYHVLSLQATSSPNKCEEIIDASVTSDGKFRTSAAINVYIIWHLKYDNVHFDVCRLCTCIFRYI